MGRTKNVRALQNQKQTQKKNRRDIWSGSVNCIITIFGRLRGLCWSSIVALLRLRSGANSFMSIRRLWSYHK